jgi:hypothetical protein
MKTSELSGAALDWAVAKCEGHDVEDSTWWADFGDESQYSTDWAQGGAIIERERICLKDAAGMYWEASLVHEDKEYGGVMRSEGQGTTPLEAAMRCYVTSKLGKQIELPEALNGQV